MGTFGVISTMLSHYFSKNVSSRFLRTYFIRFVRLFHDHRTIIYHERLKHNDQMSNAVGTYLQFNFLFKYLIYVFLLNFIMPAIHVGRVNSDTNMWTVYLHCFAVARCRSPSGQSHVKRQRV